MAGQPDDDEKTLSDLAKKILATPHKDRAETSFGKPKSKSGAPTGAAAPSQTRRKAVAARSDPDK